jgi:hypothetical protein
MRFAGPPGITRGYRNGLLAAGLAVLVIACTLGAYEVSAPRAMGDSQTAPDRPSPASGMTLAGAVATFRSHLADAHAAPDVTLRAADGAVLATGTILPPDRPAWLDAQKWFDRHLGGQYALATQVDIVPPAELPALDVAAVSMRPVPSVITRDGERYMVGAVLPGGWSIADIAADAVILRGGAREIRIGL